MGTRDVVRILTGQPLSDDDDTEPQFPGVYDARVHRVIGTQVFVTVDAIEGHAIGPVRYPGSPPSVGTVCLLAFAEGDPDLPRIVTFYGGGS